MHVTNESVNSTQHVSVTALVVADVNVHPTVTWFVSYNDYSMIQFWLKKQDEICTQLRFNEIQINFLTLY